MVTHEFCEKSVIVKSDNALYLQVTYLNLFEERLKKQKRGVLNVKQV